MMDEMATLKPPQKYFSFIIASNTLKFLDFYIQFLTFNNIPSSILAEVAGKRRSQKMKKSS